MIDVEEYQELKQKVQDAEEKANRAAGALEQCEATLKKDFKCATLKAGEKKLAAMKATLLDLEEDYNEEVATIEMKWGSA